MSTQDRQSTAPDPAWAPPRPTAAPDTQQSDPQRSGSGERGVPKAVKIALGVLGGLLLVGFGAAVGRGRDDTDRTGASAGPTVTATVTASPVQAPATVTATVTAVVTETATVTAEPPAAPAAEPGGTVPGSGTFLVGDDVEPGTYKTAGPGSLGMCYWERAKDSSGDFESIITNETLTGQGVVTIKKTDKVFKTQGCQEWVKTG
ncbi:hypothetical protein [Kitasatospora phosalacinea]|uniref:hypothetical protein n=1 Tax=Kitasatospora phosalacinea TaxID=2065 RepID=UPI00068AFF90|nr:hypothetical protein [Kitasatospora phosalacinea]